MELIWNIYWISLILSSFIVYIESFQMNITMPGVIPEKDDEYHCAAFPVPYRDQKSYILSYEAVGNSSLAHHIMIYGCAVPSSTEKSYRCTSICMGSRERVMFAWAREGARFEYPADTGMAVGGPSGIAYIVLQVHYLHATTTPDHSGFLLRLTRRPLGHVVGVMLLFAYYGVIPSRTRKAALDVSCKYTGASGYPLAFRTHAHSLGRSISGYRVSARTGQIELLGKGNPQWPQSFYRSASRSMVRHGDVVMARCLYDSTKKETDTQIGSSHEDEMCNFYVMLVTRNTGDFSTFFTCGGDEYRDLWKNVPASSMDFSPNQPDRSLHLSHGGVIEDEFGLSLDAGWKVDAVLGDVSSVSMLSGGEKDTLLVLHRGSWQHWNAVSFSPDGRHVYAGNHDRPIKERVVLEVDPVSGAVLRSGGARAGFFLPHGVTADPDGKHVWVTDVARHQVLKFRLNRGNDGDMLGELVMELGEKFVPGNDRAHFCKPSKIAIDQAGNILVADGYCNNRVICFYKNGSYADEWRPGSNEGGSMSIVHSITIQQSPDQDVTRNIVWVADRENRRVLAFTYDGSVIARLGGTARQFPLPVFALAYNPRDRSVYGIQTDGSIKGSALTILTDPDVVSGPSWLLPSTGKDAQYPLAAPHDLCIASNGSVVFVAELLKKKVLRFSLGGASSSNGDSSQQQSAGGGLHTIVDKINPAYLGMSMLAAVLFVLCCLCLLRLVVRCRRYRRAGAKGNSNSKSGSSWGDFKRHQYGMRVNDSEGFQPLTQYDSDLDDDEAAGPRERGAVNIISAAAVGADDEGDASDPETEEFAAPQRLRAKKPMV